MGKWTSRKWWVALLVILCAFFLMVTGHLEAETAMRIIVAAAAAFLGAEGIVDAARALRKS